MSEFIPYTSEPIDISDAYHIVWGAGSLALEKTLLESDERAIIADELTTIFTRLDGIRKTTANDTKNSDDQLTLYTIIEPLVQELNITKQARNRKTMLNPRIPALTSLVLLLDKSKNKLYESKNTSQSS